MSDKLTQKLYVYIYAYISISLIDHDLIINKWDIDNYSEN